jgi:hypothetical protein
MPHKNRSSPVLHGIVPFPPFLKQNEIFRLNFFSFLKSKTDLPHTAADPMKRPS